MRFAALRAGLRRWFMDAIESVICIAELTVKIFLRELPDAAWWCESFSGSFHSHSLPFASSGSFVVGQDDRGEKEIRWSVDRA
jgi:hypothetical protein